MSKRRSQRQRQPSKRHQPILSVLMMLSALTKDFAALFRVWLVHLAPFEGCDVLSRVQARCDNLDDGMTQALGVSTALRCMLAWRAQTAEATHRFGEI
jgi:hypothetical protein